MEIDRPAENDDATAAATDGEAEPTGLRKRPPGSHAHLTANDRLKAVAGAAGTTERHLAVGSDEVADATEEVPAKRLAILDGELPEVHLLDVLCIAPILLNTLYLYFGKPLSTALLQNHLTLLLAIRGTLVNILAGGIAVRQGSMPFYVPVLFPLPYLFFADPFVYWAGRRYGSRLTEYLLEMNPALSGPVARVERLMQRFGFLTIIAVNQVFIPIPPAWAYFIAGDTGMSFTKFTIANVIGVLLYTASATALGYASGNAGQNIVNTIIHYGTFLTIILIAVVLVTTYRSVRRTLKKMREQEEARRARDDPKGDESN